MPVKKPEIEELSRISLAYGLDLTKQELESFQGLMVPILDSYSRINQLPEPTLPVKYTRTSGYRPSPEHNPLGAWYWRCDIAGSPQGLLTGKTIAIKDNVCVAGIPMMNGTSVLEGYVPSEDATIVTRILDAGGTIIGKAVCESLCISGGSHTSDTGPVSNPYDPNRTAGGSSSGSAALVAAGEVDLAIGGDQGGSIRIPGSWCGIYGLKPTYGLVPYTGIFPIELTLDHTGPMARSAVDCALMLEAIAGPDGLDPRQSATLQPEAYSKLLTGDIGGLRFGLVEEGFGIEGASEKDVDDAVAEAAHRFDKLGAEVKKISIPWHKDSLHLWNAIAIEGATMLMVSGNALGTNWKGHYVTSLLDMFARGRKTRANDLSQTVKLMVMLGQYMQDRYHGHYYAKAQNLARDLRRAYDDALKEVDLLVMPTLPMKATTIPAYNATIEEYVSRALEMIPNTAAFDITGHPAMTIPCAISEGLPVGMMLVGRSGADATVLRAAHVFQDQVYSPTYPTPRPVVG